MSRNNRPGPSHGSCDAMSEKPYPMATRSRTHTHDTDMFTVLCALLLGDEDGDMDH